MSTDASGSAFIAATQSPLMMVSKGSTRSPSFVPEDAFSVAALFARMFDVPRFMAPILSQRGVTCQWKSDWSQSISVNCS